MYIEFQIYTAAAIKTCILWDTAPYSRLKMEQHLLCLLSAHVGFLAYYLTLKVEAICSSETPIDFQ
jgi:hypothetical protein